MAARSWRRGPLWLRAGDDWRRTAHLCVLGGPQQPHLPAVKLGGRREEHAAAVGEAAARGERASGRRLEGRSGRRGLAGAAVRGAWRGACDLRAGRLSPMATVSVATSSLSMPSAKRISTTSRSSGSRPEWCLP